MRFYLAAAGLMLFLPFAVGTPVLAQVSGGGGSEGTYQPETQDTGYDDMKADTEKQPSADELAAGAALVKQGKWDEAIPHLEQAQKKKPRDVTILIYLGFAHRMAAETKLGDAKDAEYKKASDYYQQGLAIDSDNKLLHEYLGKVDLLLRDYASADGEMKTLNQLCDSQCAEAVALKQAIAANPPPMTYVPAGH